MWVLLFPPAFVASTLVLELFYFCACACVSECVAHIVARAVCAAAHWSDYRITAISKCSTPIKQPQSPDFYLFYFSHFFTQGFAGFKSSLQEKDKVNLNVIRWDGRAKSSWWRVKTLPFWKDGEAPIEKGTRGCPNGWPRRPALDLCTRMPRDLKR